MVLNDYTSFTVELKQRKPVENGINNNYSQIEFTSKNGKNLGYLLIAYTV